MLRSLLLAGWMLLLALLVQVLPLVWHSAVLEAHQLPWDRLDDPDAYARLLRVVQLLEEGGWYNSTLAAINAPQGLAFHWSRALDLLLIGLSLPLLPWLSLHEAVFWACMILGPLLLLFAFGLLMGLGKALFPRTLVPLALLLFVLQLGVMESLNLGSADHHGLSIVLALSVLLLVLLGERKVARLHGYLIAGGLSGLALWNSLEFLVFLAPLIIGIGLCWLLGSERGARHLLLFTGGQLLVLLVVLLVERPLSEWGRVEYDRLSIAHLSFAVLLCGGAWMLGCSHARGWAESFAQRLLVATGLAVAGSAVMIGLFPGVVGDPVVSTSAAMANRLVSYIAAEKGMLQVSGGAGFVLLRILLELGPLVLVGPYVMYRAVKSSDQERERFLVYSVMLAFLAPWVLFAKFRALPFLQLVLLLAWLELLRVLWLRVGSAWKARRAKQQVLFGGLFAVAIVWHWVVVGSVAVAKDIALPRPDASCDFSAVADELQRHLQPGETILSDMFYGPELAWYAKGKAVGGPYHRNEQALADILSFNQAEDDRDAISVVKRRNVGVVALCRWVVIAEIERLQANPAQLKARLMTGRAPAWLRPIELPAGPSSTILLFRPHLIAR